MNYRDGVFAITRAFCIQAFVEFTHVLRIQSPTRLVALGNCSASFNGRISLLVPEINPVPARVPRDVYRDAAFHRNAPVSDV